MSLIEVLNISRHGFLLFLRDQEYFLPFEKFPWFKDTTVILIHSSVKILHRKV